MTSPSLFEALAANADLRARLEKLEGGGDMLARFETIAKEPTPQIPGSLEPTRAALHAATRLTFLIEETGAQGPERAKLLARSEALTVDGARRLRLTGPARAEVLNAAAAQGALSAELAATAASDRTAMTDRAITDGAGDARASAWLRAFLRCDPAPDANAAPETLRAALAASEALAPCEPGISSAPPPAALKRALDLADMVQPLMILIGMREDGGGDRFVGRETELARLRAFVDALAAQSLWEGATRLVKRIGRRAAQATGLGVARGMTVMARGGLGKSALMAKFVADHFLHPVTPLPFVYLDFDRASIQPRNPAQLAIEAARQLALEFPGFEEPLGRVRADLRQRLAASDSSTGGATAMDAGARDPFADLRTTIDAIVARTGARTVLIALDTVETVQSDPLAMAGVRAFLAALIGGSFPALRLVAAGRAEIPEIGGIDGLSIDPDPLTLGALPLRDARAMVDRLGRDLLGAGWSAEWTHKLAGAQGDPEARREPLTLRVAVEFMREAPPGARDALADEIAALGEAADVDFVGRLYERRVLGHIGDADVRRVAWPGLIARRLTRDLLARVLAPICGLAPEKADATFDKLSREVWIVERDGGALRHRPDLRARTLPLMRRHDPTRFDAVAAALAAHYGAAGDRVEAAYYRLVRGEDPALLPGAETIAAIDELGRAAADFDPGSPTRACLRSRSGPLMAQADFALLPAEFAFTHVARAGAALRGLGDAKVNPMALAPLDRPVNLRLLDNAALVARQSLLIKTGRWDAIDPDALRIPDQPADAALLAYFGARACVGGVLPHARAAALCTKLLDAGVTRAGPLSWMALAHLAPLARLDGGEAFADMDARLAQALPAALQGGAEARIALRVAMAWARESFAMLANHWIRRETDGPANDPAPSIEALRAVLADRSGANLDPDEMRLMQAAFAASGEDWLSPLGYAVAPLVTGGDGIAIMRDAAAAGALPEAIEKFAAMDAPDDVRARLELLREAYARWRAACSAEARAGLSS
jgi:hypothetical protein